MPQFDNVTFFNQIGWLLITFCALYFTLRYFYLPKIAAILKIRKKKSLISRSIKTLLTKEEGRLALAAISIFSSSFSFFRLSFQKKSNDHGFLFPVVLLSRSVYLLLCENENYGKIYFGCVFFLVFNF